MTTNVRPTKKQHELLDFIDEFINEHGYSPSYREIMNGLNYNSVATVALHVGNLIKRGHLRKREHSARSLEVVRVEEVESELPSGNHERWLVSRAESILQQIAEQAEEGRDVLADGQVLMDALRILGLDQQADELQLRMLELAPEPVPA